MPFPGSQQADTISFAYWLGRNILWLRLLALLLILFPAMNIFKRGGKRVKIILSSAFVLYAVVFFFVNFQMEADKMFYQPRQKLFAAAGKNKVGADKLVIGVVVNGQAKAYPIQFIGYHHQVRDMIGNTQVMITYCTVCRTGRAFSPAVSGKMENFRLVGMDHFNAMFEDAATKSWWQQATGVAIAGPLKGTVLQELPSQQCKLSAWLRLHPASLVMQPDSNFVDEYKNMANYDRGNGKSKLTKRDSLSWKPKSWIVGVSHNHNAKAYDWNKLAKNKIIEDSLPGLPILLTLDKDTATFYVFDRKVNGQTISFKKINAAGQINDIATNSVWNPNGECVDGPLKGEKLQPIQAYQEFWHSWQTFHKNTEQDE